MDAEKVEGSGWSRTPGLAKFIIIAQSIGILYFLYWTVEEYNNNYYFQQYLNSALQGGLGSLLIISAVGILTIGSAVLFVKLHRTHKELHEVLSIEASGETLEEHAKRRDGILDDATEKHLIEMIRKMQSTDGAEASNRENVASRRVPEESVSAPQASITGTPLPVLKRVDERDGKR